MPNNKSADELDKIKRDLGFLVGHGTYLKEDAREESFTEAWTKLEKYLVSEVRKARVDELAVALHMVAHMTRDDAHYSIKERLEALTKEEK